MNDNDEASGIGYDRAVIRLLQNYGLAMEAFAVASQGSPVGMENTMRLAQDAAHEVLWAALGREPTLSELEQLPPLFEGEIIGVPLKELVSTPPVVRRRPRKQ